MMETRAFSTPVLASITTGRLLEAPFSKVHEAAEFIIGHPIWTHEFGSAPFVDRLKAKVLLQHPELDVDASEVTADNYQEFADRLKAELGDTLEVVQGSGDRKADPITTLREMVPDAEVAVVQTVPEKNNG